MKIPASDCSHPAYIAKQEGALGALRAFARYKTHGGYSWGAVMADGCLVCEMCVRANYKNCLWSTKHPRTMPNSDWCVVGLANSGESEETEYCAHCNKTLWGHESDEVQS